MKNAASHRNSITRRTFTSLTVGAGLSSVAIPALAAGIRKMRVAWLPGTCGRLYAAEAFNLFRKVGLDAELIRFDTGPAMNAAFQAKSIDIGYSGVPGLLIALAAGVPMKLFLDENIADRAEGLVVGAKSGIKSVKGLRGKRVGTIIGTTAWMGLITALRKSGVLESDVHVVNLPLNTIVPSFERGDIDAVWIWAPWLFDLQKLGGKLISTDSDWLLNGNAWYGRTDYLLAHRPEVTLFLAALDQGTNKIKSNENTVAMFMSKQMGISLPATTELLHDVTFPSFSQEMQPSFQLSMNNPNGGMAKLVAEYARTFHDHGIIRHQLDLHGVVDSSFLTDYLQSNHK